MSMFKSTHSVANDHSKFMNDNKNVATIVFSVDIFQHINSLNTKLQGNQKFVYYLGSEINCFCKKLEFFSQNIGNESLHFKKSL